MLRNIVISALATIMILFICSGCAPAPERLYEGEPLSKEQVSLISDGTAEFSPLEGHGWFRSMKIDGNEKCKIKPCEILPGKHSLEVTYNWWTKANYNAVIAGVIPGTLALCFVTAGLSCALGIPVPLYYPVFDMACQGGLEFSTKGGRNYIVKIAATGNDVASLMQNTNLVIEDAELNQAVASTLMLCAKGEPRKEESDGHKTINPMAP